MPKPLRVALLGTFVLTFVALASTAMQGTTILRDEFTDYQIAESFLNNPSTDNGEDGSQARLPMYASAVAYRAASTVRLTDLPPLEGIVTAGRWVSIAACALAIVLTYTLGARWFGHAAGLLASGLLAVSPYFLTHGTTAMTEGDALGPAAVLLALLAYERYRDQPNAQRLFMLAGAIGLAAASKFYLGYLVGALAIASVFDRRTEVAPAHDQARRGGVTRLLIWTALLALCTGAGVGVTLYRRSLDIRLAKDALLLTAIAAWAATFFLLALAARETVPLIGKRPLILRPGSSLPGPLAWCVIAIVAFAVCVAVCPAHMINPRVLGVLLKRAGGWDGETPGADAATPARLYLGVVLLKLGLPLGILTLTALGWAIARALRDRALRLLVIVIVLFLFILAIMPLHQTFWLMSVYPLIVLILAAFIVWLHQTLRNVWARAACSTLVTASVTFLLVGVARVYPAFGYFGYETVGTRFLGQETRGYQDLVYVSTDGTMDAQAWLRSHAPPGAKVVSLLWDHLLLKHIDRREGSTLSVTYYRRTDTPDRAALKSADYLVVHLLNEVRYANAPPKELIAELFEPVHTVYRGRGAYRMAAVTVYQRRGL